MREVPHVVVMMIFVCYKFCLLKCAKSKVKSLWLIKRWWHWSKQAFFPLGEIFSNRPSCTMLLHQTRNIVRHGGGPSIFPRCRRSWRDMAECETFIINIEQDETNLCSVQTWNTNQAYWNFRRECTKLSFVTDDLKLCKTQWSQLSFIIAGMFSVLSI